MFSGQRVFTKREYGNGRAIHNFWGYIMCTIYKTLPIKETDISAARDIIYKIMLDNSTVRVMLFLIE